MPTLAFKNINKEFPGGKKAAVDINFELTKKELLVVVGPSGCGKTTMLRLIAGLETPTSGEIIMDGEVVNKLMPKDRSVALVFQNYALFPYMSVYENIAFGLKIAGENKAEIKRKVLSVAQALGIEGELDYKPHALSGGQRQRVALGRAIVRAPKLFLFDEPLSNLDSKLRYEMRNLISELYDNTDATFVYVTHDQVEAMTMGTLIAVMRDGELQQLDTPQMIYDRPKNKFVGSFIGSEMNFFGGKLGFADGKATLNAFDEVMTLPPDVLGGRKFREGETFKVDIGLRAEDIYVSSGDEEGFIMNATVKSVDILGRNRSAVVEVSVGTLTIITDKAVNRGDEITICLDKHKMHLFSAESGKNLYYEL